MLAASLHVTYARFTCDERAQIGTPLGDLPSGACHYLERTGTELEIKCRPYVAVFNSCLFAHTFVGAYPELLATVRHPARICPTWFQIITWAGSLTAGVCPANMEWLSVDIDSTDVGLRVGGAADHITRRILP